MRHRVASSLMIVIALASAPFALACRAVEGDGTPGQTIGTFAVRGALEQNACAPGLETIDPLEFSVTLSRDRGTLTWRMQGGGPVFGTIDDDGTFRVRSSQEVEAWPADPVNGIRGCRLTQSETIRGTIHALPSVADGGVASDAGVPDDAGGQADAGDAGASARPRFEATHRIEILPVAGSDCAPLLIVYGGDFPSLPCAADYDLTAAAR